MTLRKRTQSVYRAFPFAMARCINRTGTEIKRTRIARKYAITVTSETGSRSNFLSIHPVYLYNGTSAPYKMKN